MKGCCYVQLGEVKGNRLTTWTHSCETPGSTRTKIPMTPISATEPKPSESSERRRNEEAMAYVMQVRNVGCRNYCTSNL